MKPDDELNRVLRQIDVLNNMHRTMTGMEPMHVGPCGCVELHERLAWLHRRAEQLFRVERGDRQTPRVALKLATALGRKPDDYLLSVTRSNRRKTA